ncbi:MAG: hypothetical protein EB034_14480 [Verrucomicrobia bacterium]|nr:hypothetical protein [Verrucomicrobiota bacterium]
MVRSVVLFWKDNESRDPRESRTMHRATVNSDEQAAPFKQRKKSLEINPLPIVSEVPDSMRSQSWYPVVPVQQHKGSVHAI